MPNSMQNVYLIEAWERVVSFGLSGKVSSQKVSAMVDNADRSPAVFEPLGCSLVRLQIERLS